METYTNIRSCMFAKLHFVALHYIYLRSFWSQSSANTCPDIEIHDWLKMDRGFYQSFWRVVFDRNTKCRDWCLQRTRSDCLKPCQPIYLCDCKKLQLRVAHSWIWNSLYVRMKIPVMYRKLPKCTVEPIEQTYLGTSPLVKYMWQKQLLDWYGA